MENDEVERLHIDKAFQTHWEAIKLADRFQALTVFLTIAAFSVAFQTDRHLTVVVPVLGFHLDWSIAMQLIAMGIACSHGRFTAALEFAKEAESIIRGLGGPFSEGMPAGTAFPSLHRYVQEISKMDGMSLSGKAASYVYFAFVFVLPYIVGIAIFVLIVMGAKQGVAPALVRLAPAMLAFLYFSDFLLSGVILRTVERNRRTAKSRQLL